MLSYLRQFTGVSGSSSAVISDWAIRHLAPGSHFLSDRLACRAVITAKCHHKAFFTERNYPNDLPQFRWISTLLGILKTSSSGTFDAFNFDMYARLYLVGYCFSVKRRFSMAGLIERTSKAACCCMPLTERDLRVAALCGYPRFF